MREDRPRALDGFHGILQARDIRPQIVQIGRSYRDVHRLDERRGRIFDPLPLQLQALLRRQGVRRDFNLDVGEGFGLTGQPVTGRQLLRAQPVLFGLGKR